MKVLKFGGTSVGTSERMHNVLNIIEDTREGNVIVVLSAMSGTTNKLKQIATYIEEGAVYDAKTACNHLAKEYVVVVYDLFLTQESIKNGLMVVNKHFNRIHSLIDLPYSPTNEKIISAQGEFISTALFQILCQESGVKSSLLNSIEFMKTDEENCPDYDFIQEHLPAYLNGKENHLFITQGYVCKDVFGRISNLGRGGSDYTATIIGAVLKAEEIQIWTDIDGIHNNDPRYVQQTELIAEMSYEEASNLAFFGAKILHPACVTPAQEALVPIRIKNTFDPYTEGTLISRACTKGVECAISTKDNEVLVNITSNNSLSAFQFYSKVFEAFEASHIQIDMMTIAHQSVTVVVNDSYNLGKVVTMLRDYASIHHEHELAIINIIGAFQKKSKSAMSRIISGMKKIKVRLTSQQKGEQNYVRLLVRSKDKIKAMRAVDLAINHHKRGEERQNIAGVA